MLQELYRKHLELIYSHSNVTRTLSKALRTHLLSLQCYKKQGSNRLFMVTAALSLLI